MTFSATTHQQRRFKLIKRPHVSEKATLLADKLRQFVFEVQKDANKSEVKQAVESLFNVKLVVLSRLKGISKPGKRLMSV
jgi:large subunit ribosomal protein L23